MSNTVVEKDNVMRLMEMTAIEVKPGYAKISMPLKKEFKNGMGFAHGGTIFSLADIAFGAAANEGVTNFVVTLTTSIEYLRPGSVGPLVAEAQLIRGGKHIQNYEVLVYDGEGTLIARTMTSGYTTTALLPPSKEDKRCQA
ncbi:MAG: PaaI family thioesterase [Desulfovibrio sp.]|nr:PaaI family thioesterase [Desulfovibrio sp.]